MHTYRHLLEETIGNDVKWDRIVLQHQHGTNNAAEDNYQTVERDKVDAYAVSGLYRVLDVIGES